MLQMSFSAILVRFIIERWDQVLHEAEDVCRDMESGSRAQIQRIQDVARVKLVEHLEELKGERLSIHEHQFALDLFDRLASEVDYFKILQYAEAKSAPPKRKHAIGARRD